MKSNNCPVCNVLRGRPHQHFCTEQSPVERIAAQVYVIESYTRRIERLEQLCRRLREQVTLWQGKHAIVRHENNRLRRKPQRGEAAQ